MTEQANKAPNKAPANLTELRGQPQAEAPPPKKGLLALLQSEQVAKGLGAVATKYLDAERMLRIATFVARKNPRLLECEPQTVLGALMTSTALGLEPNTELRQAYLIPYRTRRKINGQWSDVYECQFQIGYPGYINLAYRSPRILSLQANAIRDGDLFEHEEGSHSFLRYSKSLDVRGELRGAFCYTRLADGEASTVLPAADVAKIRDRSETYRSLRERMDAANSALHTNKPGTKAHTDAERDYKKALKNWDETPWNLWPDAMWAKSAIKLHCRSRLPLTPEDPLAVATAIDAEAESGLLDLTQMTDPDRVREIIEGNAPTPERDIEPEVEEEGHD